jgi:hypothetical protein
MRILFKLLLWLILLSPFALAGLAWFSLSDEALVTNSTRLSHNDIGRAKAVLEKNNPGQLPAGTTQVISLTERDLNLAANYLLQQLAAGGAQVRIHPDLLDAVGTLRIPGLPIRQYLNISLQLQEQAGQAHISSLRLGSVDIPAGVAQLVADQVLALLQRTEQYQLAGNLVQKVAIQRDQLLVTYRSDPTLVERARASLLSKGDTEALRAYHAELLRLQANGIGRGASLADLLKPMFALAQERSRNGDPVAENQALLTLLGSWSSKGGLGSLLPDEPQPERFRLKLEGRYDFAQHFLTSAGLAARGDSSLADAIGLFKEIADSDGGSGFSFTDIAADRAGTRFGVLASGSPEQARRLQAFMAKGVRETDIMPPARDLPEHMDSEEFQRRYGGVGSPAYQAVMDDIEARIAACAVHKL